MSLALRIKTRLTVGRTEMQSALGVCSYCRMIHQCEADRKKTDLSPACQTRRSERGERN